MVKTVLSFIFFLQLVVLSAQNFKVENEYVSAQGSITEEISPPTSIRNLTRQPIILHWEVAKKHLPEGWTIMVNDRYITEKGILTLANSELFSDFKVNFQPNGLMGVGTVEIVVFDPSNRAATETDITFTASAAVSGLPSAMSGMADVPQVFPNPATDYISVSSQTNAVKKMEVFNIVGRKVMDLYVTASDEKHDVSTLPRGMYLIRLIDAQGNILRTQRISKYNP